MPGPLAAALQVGLLVTALALVHVPLGDGLARVFTDRRNWRVEAWLYRAAGIDPSADQRWATYARSVVALSLVSVLALYALLRLQGALPLSLGHGPVPPTGAWNTAVSFTTNTNWQWYSGETVLGHLVQMAGLAVQNFVSAAVGLAVAVALARSFTRSGTDRVGNFWVDVTRAVIRVLLPLSLAAAVVLLLCGVVQNFAGAHPVVTLAGGTQEVVGGPVASQEAIKELGTNGGGFYNANSSHPFENPTPWTNLVEVFLLLLIPFSLPRTFGTLVGDRRQGRTLLAVMGGLWLVSVALATWAEASGAGSVPRAAGAAMEGKEVRFGEAGSALFAASTTATSTGSVNSMHDSFTAPGGGVPLANIMLGEVSPGGVGAGLYGVVVLAILTVFLAGLMVGRTPQYLGRKVGRREVTLLALYVLTTPALLLVGAAVTVGVPGLRDAALLNTGAHGLSEALYAYASASNNNGSAFAGFASATPYQEVVLGVCMIAGRYVPMLLVLALAGAVASQRRTPETTGTLPTHGPLFGVLLAFVIVVVAGLTFFPALALSPVAEALR